MEMNDMGDYVLSTGKVVEVDYDRLSLNAEGELATGYDCCVDGSHKLTTEERAEIAGEMITRWQKWAKEIIDG